MSHWLVVYVAVWCSTHPGFYGSGGTDTIVSTRETIPSMVMFESKEAAQKYIDHYSPAKLKSGMRIVEVKEVEIDEATRQ